MSSLLILETPHYKARLVETNKALLLYALQSTPAHIFKARVLRFALNSLAIVVWMVGPGFCMSVLQALASFH